MNSVRQNNWYRYLIRSFLLCAALMSSSAVVRADDSRLLDAIEKTQTDIDTAQTELARVRQEIAQKRLPLRERQRALSDAVRRARERHRQLMDADRISAEARQQLEREVLQLEEERNFIMTALIEYRRSVETRMQAAERMSQEKVLASVDDALMGNVSGFEQTVGLVFDTALAWHEKRSRGYSFDGAILDPDGIELTGRYRVVGPLVYFADRENRGALVTGSIDDLRPSAFFPDKAIESKSIAAFVEGVSSVAIPVDVSGGAALQREQMAENLWLQVRRGGFVMLPLLLVGILSLLIVVSKIVSLRGLQHAVHMSIDPIAESVGKQQWDAAMALARQLRPPLGTLMGEALVHRASAKEHLEEILHERMLAMTPGWERYLGALAVFGAVAPLLGLLGTVTGMIHTFELVTLFGTGEARLLSGGISEALITTKFGLAIAIPVLVAHAFLVRKLRVIIGTLEGTMAGFVNLLSDVRNS